MADDCHSVNLMCHQELWQFLVYSLYTASQIIHTAQKIKQSYDTVVIATVTHEECVSPRITCLLTVHVCQVCVYTALFCLHCTEYGGKLLQLMSASLHCVLQQPHSFSFIPLSSVTLHPLAWSYDPSPLVIWVREAHIASAGLHLTTHQLWYKQTQHWVFHFVLCNVWGSKTLSPSPLFACGCTLGGQTRKFYEAPGDNFDCKRRRK